MVSEQLEDSLRHEIESYVERRLSGLKQEIAQLQNQLNESLKLILEREGETQWDGSLATAVAEHLRAAHERGIELAASESTRAQASSDMAIVKAGIDEIVDQQSQAEILKTLVNRASSFAPRVAFFVVKGEQALGWRARGFRGSVGDEAVQQITFPLLADTVVGQVAKSCTTWSGTPDSQQENHLLLHRLGEQAPPRIVAVPLVVRGRSVAVLYADSAALDSEAINLEALETLVRVAGMAVELLSVSLAAAAQPQPAAQSEVTEAAEDAPAYVPEREYEELAAEPGEATEELPAVEPVPMMADSESIEAAATLDQPVDQAVDESVDQPAAVEPKAAPPPATPARRRYSYDAELPVEVHDEEERRQHNDARRFARLLVSEIKLYNEQRVVEGRSEGDLYERLREYIERSREMYEKRVKPGVSAKYDYFHDELVRTLAEGDASKLGEAYPGTTVSA